MRQTRASGCRVKRRGCILLPSPLRGAPRGRRLLGDRVAIRGRPRKATQLPSGEIASAEPAWSSPVPGRKHPGRGACPRGVGGGTSGRRINHPANAPNPSRRTAASPQATVSDSRAESRAARVAGLSSSRMASSISMRTSAMSCIRRWGSFCRHRRITLRASRGILSGSDSKSGSRSMMAAMVSVRVAPANARSPVSIS